MGKHELEIRPAQPGDRGAHRISDLVNDPHWSKSTYKSPVTNEEVPIPDGGLRAHLRRRAADLGSDDAYVTLTIHYRRDPGEPKPPVPPNATRTPDRLR